MNILELIRINPTLVVLVAVDDFGIVTSLSEPTDSSNDIIVAVDLAVVLFRILDLPKRLNFYNF